jgi:CHAD domain-containing protein
MKQKEMIEIIEGVFKNIDKLCGKILKTFNADDIHDFRVEVKKLRAFLRLLDIKKEGSIIPKLLKYFYTYAGNVRNIQLYEQSLFEYIKAHDVKKPDEYIKLLNNEKKYWKKEARNLVKKDDFSKTKEKILKGLPAKLEKPGIKKFVQNKLDNLKLQLEHLNDDNPLHSIRKILKDIFYNWDYIKYYAVLPASISNKEALKLLTTMLGEFIDKFMQLEFLKPVYLDKINNEDEKILLKKIRTLWLRKKRAIKEKLQPELVNLKQQLINFELSV